MQKKRFDRRSSSYISASSGTKKGQVTVFIILGLLLLLGLILVVTLQKEITQVKPEEVIPLQKGKVETFVTNCIQNIGEEGLTQMGLQAGFIKVPEDVASNSERLLRVSPMHVVPYWAYQQELTIPSLEELKERLDLYVEDNLKSCLFENEPFQEAYDVLEKSGITADTQIVDRQVIFDVDWQIEVRDKQGEVISELFKHTVSSPIKLKRVYETSRKIVEKEMQFLKFEDIAQDLLALEHPDVPLAGFEVSCQQKVWKVAEVKETYQDMLRVNIREIKIKGTDIVEFPEELPYYKNHYIWDLELEQPEVEVQFLYENYPLSFAVLPISGNKLKSNQLGGTTDLLKLACFQNWKFNYDLDFPVRVDVRDVTTGYTFTTAFTVHLRRNMPDRSGAVYDVKTFVYDTVTDDEFCEDKRVPMTVYTYQLTENNATGVFSRDPLDYVKLTFTCVKYACEMGDSEYDFGGRGDVAGIETDFPYCTGGILRGEKEGYLDDWKLVVTRDDAEVALDLRPLKIFSGDKISVVKHELISGILAEELQVGDAQDLEEGETAIIKIEYGKKSPERSLRTNEPLFESDFVFRPGDDKIQPEQELNLLSEADYTYFVEITVMNEENFVGGFKDKVTIPWAELDDAEEVVFHVVALEDASEDERFELFLDIEEQSKLIEGVELE